MVCPPATAPVLSVSQEGGGGEPGVLESWNSESLVLGLKRKAS